MAVLSLLALIMMGSLKFSARVWERTQANSDDTDAISTAQAFIRHQLAVAYPQWQDTGSDRPHILFDGEPQQISFLAPAPAQFGPGTNLRYTLQRAKNGDLEVVWQSQQVGAAPSPTTLLSNIASISIDYFGAPFGQRLPKWSDSWSNRARLPDLVRIRIAFPPGDRRVWPELIVHPDITVDVRCIYEPLTRTCRGRPE
jgi:general secretion pathway protein J